MRRQNQHRWHVVGVGEGGGGGDVENNRAMLDG